MTVYHSDDMVSTGIALNHTQPESSPSCRGDATFKPVPNRLLTPQRTFLGVGAGFFAPVRGYNRTNGCGTRAGGGDTTGMRSARRGAAPPFITPSSVSGPPAPPDLPTCSPMLTSLQQSTHNNPNGDAPANDFL